MGEEEDEDYMGDLSKFIPNSEPKKLKQIQSQQPTNKKPKFLHNTQHQKKLKKSLKQQEEDIQTLENIKQSTIPQSNIGYKLLKQMGYKPGEGNEPLGIEIRRTRAGIGREDPLKEKVEVKMKSERVLMEDFEGRMKMEWKAKRVVGNYYKAKGVFDFLENREIVVVDKKDECSYDEEEVVTEEDLIELLVKLREEHFYCLFCGCQYESKDALLSNCPGLDEEDH